MRIRMQSMVECNLIKESKDFTTSLFATTFFVIHDSGRSSQDQVSELTGRQEVVDPGFDILLLDVESRRDDTSLVDSANQLNYNLSRSMIINDFKFTNVSYNS